MPKNHQSLPTSWAGRIIYGQEVDFFRSRPNFGRICPFPSDTGVLTKVISDLLTIQAQLGIRLTLWHDEG